MYNIFVVEKNEQYIIDEAPEISVGESPAFTKIFALFPALENKNYQIYFSAGLVSLIGTWLQIVAEAALIVYVLRPPNTALWVGIDGAAATLPTLLFSLFGGVIVDRFPKKNILIFTQSAAMILALIYGLLTVFGLINIYGVIVLAFLLGMVTAVDSPARQAFVPTLVTQEQLGSAIALNSGVFNAARVIGPTLAGILTGIIGAGGAFITNGLSYAPVILGLFYMKIHESIPSSHPSPFKAIKEGISYSFSHPIIRTLLFMTAITSIFGWSYSTMLPVLAVSTFHLNPTGLGYLYAASGLGALTAAFVVSALSRKNLSIYFILGGNAVFALSIIFFTFVRQEGWALIFLFLVGVGLLAQFTTINTTLQHLVNDEVRGRVMSIYTLMFIGLLPFGNFEVGFLSNILGAEVAIRIGAIIVFIFGLFILFSLKKIKASYAIYKER